MKIETIHRSIFSIILPVGLIFFLFIFSQWYTPNEGIDSQGISAIACKTSGLQGLNAVDTKQRGAHVFGTIDSTNSQSLYQNNLEWVTMVSWGFQDDVDSPNVTHHNGDSSYILQHDVHWIRQIERVRAAGYKVFFKPHLWVQAPSDGKWRSDIFPTSDVNWELWKQSYRDFILRYAMVAEKANAEMYCIGAEFSRLTIEKPEFWRELIGEIKTVYSGKITYAANWYKEYEKVTFWDELDYIGIQAYFPLAKNKYPTVKQISKGWKKYLPAMESVHKKYNRKILFTEMGYKSTADSAIEPWQWIEHSDDKSRLLSTETQANCYQAFFNTVWKKEWLAGVHIWQLRSDYGETNSNYKDYGGANNLDFTPQGKPAADIIARGFE